MLILQNSIVISVAIYIFLLLRKKIYNKVLIISIVSLFCIPYLNLIGAKIHFSYILVGIYLFNSIINFKITGKVDKLLYLIILELIIQITSTIINLAFNSKNIVFLGTSIVGTIKSIIIFIIFYKLSNLTYRMYHYNKLEFTKLILKSLRIILIINLFFMIIQLLKPNLGVSLISNFYSSVSRMTLSSDIDTFKRLYGASYSPVVTGYVILLGLSIEIFSFKNKFFWILLYIIVGLFTSTKTFILGAVILYVFYVIAIIFTKKKSIIRKIIEFIIVMLITIIVIYIIKLILEKSDLYLAYYLKKSFDIKEMLLNRVEDNYYTGEMINYIKKSILIGNGFNVFGTYKIADSDYLVSLYYGGILGLIAHISTYLYLLFKSINSKNIILLVVTSIIMIIGYGQITLITDQSLILISLLIVKDGLGGSESEK